LIFILMSHNFKSKRSRMISLSLYYAKCEAFISYTQIWAKERQRERFVIKRNKICILFTLLWFLVLSTFLSLRFVCIYTHRIIFYLKQMERDLLYIITKNVLFNDEPPHTSQHRTFCNVKISFFSPHDIFANIFFMCCCHFTKKNC
jgi:hypothetical protein